ncbi:VIT domain-containing protein [Pedobacter metabolipauper]|uniref:Uncharacterized protein YfaP (DUF2135 family) n=1 Tax=Pedobacter metabolipauper TaxID=425513 RepID=A0A4R6T230_9SPHI|nr:VIT domain-containing protein [Pedobacter metabolipauper]TDQ11381.1 uncharacterized protein YfaP (DUF2135 family) [Pedobacter metabolipauper]
MKVRSLLLSLLITSVSFSAFAQAPQIKISGTNPKDARAVSLQSLQVDVKITGNIATTVMTMSFYNASARVLEGELTFPLPDGVTVSRYALDINGKMREAVPVEKAKATEVFESIERRRVDPGLLEKVEGNNFRTRIYPFPVNGIRTITIGYEEELRLNGQQAFTYRLPLDFKQAIPDFSLRTTVLESSSEPVMSEQPDGSFKFKSQGNTYTAILERKNFLPKQALAVELPKVTDALEVVVQKAGSSAYFLANIFIKGSSRNHQLSSDIGLIWDVSLSGLNRDKVKEFALLDALIKDKKNLTIHLGLLNHVFKNGGDFVINNGNWNALREKLGSLIYDGGADYSKINSRLVKGDEYLFFTDGFSGFGPNTVYLNKPVHTINTALRADFSQLKYIAAKSGGKFINLNTFSASQAYQQLSKEELQLISIKNNTAVTELYPSVPTPVNGLISIAGISSAANTSMTLQFGYGNTVTMERKVTINAGKTNASMIDVSRIWAQKKLSEMDQNYEDNKVEIAQLAQQFGIVTRNTSLMVLESVDDYIRYGIEPPDELKPLYDQVKKQRMAMVDQGRRDLLNSSMTMAKVLQEWWNRDFPKVKVFPKPDKADNQMYDAVSMPPAVLSSERSVATHSRRNSTGAEMELNEVVVVASGTQRKSSMVGAARSGRAAGIAVQRNADQQSNPAGPEIKVPEFKSDKGYMKKLQGSSSGAYKSYLAIRPEYESTPSFYLDMANWFYQQKDSVRALLILSNLTELDLENSEIYKSLAYKLTQAGDPETALFISKKVVKWRPMEAQSYRDYALALANCGKYQQALDTLYQVLTKSYNADISNRDQGIEEIILAEINNLIVLHGDHLNTSRIDPKLIFKLPVDVRVVLNWNKIDTDIDLWVTDPNGEKCYYKNKLTAAGGRISDDFTGGYGPEQFMIKKAIKGKYIIHVDYYGDNHISISGPTVVMAEIYTNYGKVNQERKVITLQMSGKKDNGILIGSFEF